MFARRLDTIPHFFAIVNRLKAKKTSNGESIEMEIDMHAVAGIGA
jgi:hypothetical protein